MLEGKVLVVDDEASICRLCAASLRNVGFDVDTTCNPFEALERVSAEPFDVVLTDVKMPELGGIELIRKLRSVSPEIAVVLMTGFATMEVAVRALQEGAANFIHKPFNVEEMVWAIRGALERKRLVQENIRLNTLVNLFQVSDRMATTREPSKIYNILLEAACHETGAQRAAVFDRDEESCELYLRYGVNLKEFMAEGTRVPEKFGLAAAVFSSQEPILINDWNEAKGLLPVLGEDKWGTAAMAVPLKSNNGLKGVLTLYRSGGNGFTQADLDGAKLLANQAAVALENADLLLDLEILFLETMKSLATTVDERDPYTHGHSQRVAAIAVAIGREMGLPDDKIEELELAGNLHDIGKIGIRDSILLKPGRLTDEEYEVIKTHVEKGYKILRHIQRLSPVVEAVYTHHEWWNGGGYPRGLKGEEIPLAGAIISVADAFDTMTTDRPYHKRRKYKEAMRILREAAGTQFHPKVVEALGRIDPEEFNLPK
jgi:putative nucleotidyltransferase with HDIG domain